MVADETRSTRWLYDVFEYVIYGNFPEAPLCLVCSSDERARKRGQTRFKRSALASARKGHLCLGSMPIGGGYRNV